MTGTQISIFAATNYNLNKYVMRRMKHVLVCLLLMLPFLSENLSAKGGERKILFDKEWHFYKGNAQGAENVAYDDSSWRAIDLPHDWSIEPLDKVEGVEIVGPFSRNSVGGPATGQTVGGEGWYRKRFTLTSDAKDKRLELYFEGVYNQAEIWVNGKKAGYNVYGYSAFRCDITDLCQPAGEENVVAVKVVNAGKNSRWYAGSGIYRHVWLLQTDHLRLDEWETAVGTTKLNADDADIAIRTNIINGRKNKASVMVEAQILSAEGKEVAFGKIETSVSPTDSIAAQITLKVKNPQLWSPASPSLYTTRLTLKKGRKVVDEIDIPFGIRTIEFSAEKGFLLNGQPTILYGGCIHHDNGLLGAAAYNRAEERKVELLKANGFNAVRCSHNPPSEHFLHACDRLGLLVIDEAFDQWSVAKNPQDYHLFFNEWCVKDIQTMVRRDRNHPSIIMWSIGNEIRERITGEGLAIAEKLKKVILACDTSRPVTAGINKQWDEKHENMLSLDKAFQPLDVAGYNYMWRFYEQDHKNYPSRIMYGSESVAMELADNWKKVEKYPYVIGDFVWTAIDYLGEAGIGNALEIDPEENVAQFMDWPWYNGWCGDIDLCGVKKPQSYFRDVVWRIKDIAMAVESPITEGKRSKVSFWGWTNEDARWTYPGREGMPLTVNVYSRSSKVRLYLNEKLIGEKTVSDTYKAAFSVPYQSGVLKAVCWDGYKEGSSVCIRTTGTPTALRLSADRTVIKADGQDLSYVLVELIDEQGNVVFDNERKIRFTCNGKGRVIATGNASPNDMESFRSDSPKFFKGRAMIILKSNEAPGNLQLNVSSEGIQSASLQIKVE